MNTLKKFILNNGTYLIHPLRKLELNKQDLVVNDLFEIFGDINSIPFNKEKYVINKEVLYTQLLGVTIGFELNIRYIFFITEIETDKIIGEIIIIPTKSVEESYNIKDTWLLEFYLNKKYRNNGIMTNAINGIILNLNLQGIEKIGVLVDRTNIASGRVIEKCNFVKIRQIDVLKDYFKKIY